MSLGPFYPALAVSDIKKSYEFYKALDFEVVENGGSLEENWLVLSNGKTKIGLFQGMFPENMFTFQPEDARTIYKKFKDLDYKINFASKNIDEADGPCSFAVSDPDGNTLLFDQG